MLSDCLLLDVVLSLSLALVFGTIFLPMSLQHLITFLAHFPKPFKIASLSTFLSWPCPLNYFFSPCVVLLVAVCYLSHPKNLLID